ncbi:MAG: STAS domain-containing protein [Clostridia bacterium]|nr:STAS domain-containing protein [Clostridia bacterium]
MADVSPAWTDDDFEGLADVLEAYRRHADEISAEVAAGRGAQVPRVRGSFGVSEFAAAIRARDIGPLIAAVEAAVPELVREDVPLEAIVQELARLTGPLHKSFAADYADDPVRLARAFRTYGKLRDAIAVAAATAYAKRRVEALQEEQRRILRQLSTPVIQVWEDILVMPLIGVVDSVRARQMMEQLLTRITELGSRIVILDVTGVPTVDTEVANHFIRTMKAARLVGARTILVGISPQVALTLVRLDVGLEGLETYSDLRSGLERAFALLGYRIDRPGAAAS